MRWSKLKKLIESNFAPCLQKRLEIHQTLHQRTYKSMSTVWLTLDGEKLATFCNWAFYQRYKHDRDNEVLSSDDVKKKSTDALTAFGEYSADEILAACEKITFTHSVEDCLDSDDALLQGLAVLNQNCGKRRLYKLRDQNLPPLVLGLIDMRTQLACEQKEKA